MNTNAVPFAAQVGEATAYYAALLQSIDSIVGREQSERAKVEEAVSCTIANSVACEGKHRVERCEVFRKWRAWICMAGLKLKALRQNVARSMRSGVNVGNSWH
ncbi:hypothetical protein SLA2020_248820 [Shorea laevis]